MIWGESWNPLCWEASEAFIRQWLWILEGCEEMFLSSTKWQELRGDTPIEIENT